MPNDEVKEIKKDKLSYIDGTIKLEENVLYQYNKDADKWKELEGEDIIEGTLALVGNEVYIYDNKFEEDNNLALFEEKVEEFEGYKRKINISDDILKKYNMNFKFKISKEDIFYYIYGLLNSNIYKKTFNYEMKKMTPRLPLSKNFKLFSKAGRDLANLHLNYEDLDPYPLKNKFINKSKNYNIHKMKFGKNTRIKGFTS
jgi:predicted helicase